MHGICKKNLGSRCDFGWILYRGFSVSAALGSEKTSAWSQPSGGFSSQKRDFLLARILSETNGFSICVGSSRIRFPDSYTDFCSRMSKPKCVWPRTFRPNKTHIDRHRTEFPLLPAAESPVHCTFRLHSAVQTTRSRFDLLSMRGVR